MSIFTDIKMYFRIKEVILIFRESLDRLSKKKGGDVKMWSWIKSAGGRKFLLALVAAIIVLLNEGFSMNLPKDKVMEIAKWSIGLFIGFEGTKDIIVAIKGSKK